jgi:hypothetical protein
MAGMAGLDAWLTREPDYPQEVPQPRCAGCGSFLSRRADRTLSWTQTDRCDGQPQVFTASYTEADRGILDIIGWEHLGESYTVEYDPVCGGTPVHEPHEMVVADGIYEYRDCRRCGLVNKEMAC